MMRVVRTLFNNSPSKRLALVLAFLCLLSLNLITANIVVADNPCPNSWNITLQGLKSTYNRGETINVSATYSIRNHSLSPGTIQQILVGIVDENRHVYDVTCIYNGSANVCPQETNGTANFALKCPSNPGVYQILASNYQLYSCEDAKQSFPKNPASDRVITTIQVSGSLITSNPNTTANAPSVTPPSSPINQTFIIPSWLRNNQNTVVLVIILVGLAFIGLRRLLNKKLNGWDKFGLILLLAAALIYILLVFIIPWVTQNWIAVLISLAMLIVVVVIALKRGWITLGQGSPASTWHTELKKDIVGYVYVMHCPAHPIDWFKIGWTQRPVDERSSELTRETGVPAPFLLVNQWEVTDAKIERLVHQALNEYRINPKKEFFRAPYSVIAATIDKVIREADSTDSQ
jgi:hypothetical protein